MNRVFRSVTVSFACTILLTASSFAQEEWRTDIEDFAELVFEDIYPQQYIFDASLEAKVIERLEALIVLAKSPDLFTDIEEVRIVLDLVSKEDRNQSLESRSDQVYFRYGPQARDIPNLIFESLSPEDFLTRSDREIHRIGADLDDTDSAIGLYPLDVVRLRRKLIRQYKKAKAETYSGLPIPSVKDAFVLDVRYSDGTQKYIHPGNLRFYEESKNISGDELRKYMWNPRSDVHEGKEIDSIVTLSGDELWPDSFYRDSSLGESMSSVPLTSARDNADVDEMKHFLAVDMPNGLHMKVPRAWRVLDGATKTFLETNAEAALNLSGIDVEKLPSEILFQVVSTPLYGYATVSVQVRQMEISDEELRSISGEELEDWTIGYREGLEEAMKVAGRELLEFQPMKVEKLGGKPCLVSRYRRSGDDGDVLIETRLFSVNGQGWDILFSHRVKDAPKLKAILRFIEESISFE